MLHTVHMYLQPSIMKDLDRKTTTHSEQGGRQLTNVSPPMVGSAGGVKGSPSTYRRRESYRKANNIRSGVQLHIPHHPQIKVYLVQPVVARIYFFFMIWTCSHFYYMYTLDS